MVDEPGVLLVFDLEYLEETLSTRLFHRLHRFDGICRMIEAGLGIGILPLASVRSELLSRVDADDLPV